MHAGPGPSHVLIAVKVRKTGFSGSTKRHFLALSIDILLMGTAESCEVLFHRGQPSPMHVACTPHGSVRRLGRERVGSHRMDPQCIAAPICCAGKVVCFFSIGIPCTNKLIKPSTDDKAFSPTLGEDLFKRSVVARVKAQSL